VLLYKIANLEQRDAHLYAKRLRFFGSCNSASIIIGKHDHRDADEPLIENAFTTYVEIIAINQRYT
jgi:hypothetical protein